MTKQHQKLDQRVAVIPVLKTRCKDKRKCKVFLVTCQARSQWIIPTGKLEKNMSNRRVVMMEAFEEAGILGKLDNHFKLQVRLQSAGGKKRRKPFVFLLHIECILKNSPEGSERKRKAVGVERFARGPSS